MLLTFSDSMRYNMLNASSVGNTPKMKGVNVCVKRCSARARCKRRLPPERRTQWLTQSLCLPSTSKPMPSSKPADSRA